MTRSNSKPTADNAKRPSAASIVGVESKLQRLDQQLVKLVNERAQLAVKLGQLKQDAGQPAFVLGEEEAQIAQLIGLNEGPLSNDCLRAVLRELISGSRSLIRTQRIAFLGPLYSYSHLAAIERFGQSVEFAAVSTIAAVFEEVNRGHSNYGIVPIENSTDGRVADTLDMFTRLPVKICAEVVLPIHHTLLGKGSRTEVQEVYSKPQALSQCRNWLAKHLPSARLIEVTSTTTAAQLAAEKPTAAAIASLQAGKFYGLGVLAEQIEDNPDNTTRFAVISDRSAPRTGHDKVALMFQTHHRSGSLVEALAIFKRNRLNLTWIESFPVFGSARTYLFFVELEGHETDSRVRRAIQSLEKKALRLEILGSYAAVSASTA